MTDHEMIVWIMRIAVASIVLLALGTIAGGVFIWHESERRAEARRMLEDTRTLLGVMQCNAKITDRHQKDATETLGKVRKGVETITQAAATAATVAQETAVNVSDAARRSVEEVVAAAKSFTGEGIPTTGP